MSSSPALPAQRRHELSDAATKKVFKRLIPFLLLMYVIAFLDRSNVSFAQKEFEVDFGISAAAYAFGAGLFFVGYAIFEVPSNLLLHRVGARWWLARIMVSWGIVSAAFMFVQGPISFYVLRFLLGVMEAGFFPGVILYLTYWVPARHLSQARGYFYMGIALAGILGNPLSGSLLELSGTFGLRGIQWMFLVEGLLAVVVGLWSYSFLTDKPDHATWLPDDEREALVETIDAENIAKAEGHGPQKVVTALANWRVWYFALIYFCIQIAVYGVTFFLPTHVVAITGQKLGFAASLVTAVPWVFALIAVAIFPRMADRTRKHRLIGSTLLLITAVGIIISGALSNNPVFAIAGLCLAAIGFVSMQPIFWTLPTEYMTGYAAAAGIGLINSLGNLGGFLAPIQREYFNETIGGNAGLYSLALGAVLGAVLFAITALFKKANDVEAGHLDEVDAHYVPHEVAEPALGRVAQSSKTYQQMLFR
jgi:sugar phosphate permease